MLIPEVGTGMPTKLHLKGKLLPTAGLPSLSSIDILDQIMLCCWALYGTL